MTTKNLYNSLIKIGLEEYLNTQFGGKTWYEEQWLLGLDIFVGNLSEKNLNILKDKFSTIQNNQQKNDELNEVIIACAYHPSALFVSRQDNKKTYDLFDESINLKIEVKTLNESMDEQNRHNNQKQNNGTFNIGKMLSDFESEKKKKLVTASLEKKCSDKLTSAVYQLENKGKIYLIYDYDLLSKNFNNSISRALLSKEEVVKIIENYCIAFSIINSNINIETIFFEDLLKKIA